MKLALFDFDGTITKKDTLAGFIQFLVGKPAYYLGLFKLSPLLIAYSFKLVPNNVAKEKLISCFVGGMQEKKFKELAKEYAEKHIDAVTRDEAITRIKWHQKEGHKVVVVSASMECWLKAWCDKNSIELISTTLEIKSGKITGKFATRNCHGIEKVNRIKESYNLNEYKYIYAYGDSSGDKEMLELADESYYKPFRNKNL